MMSDPAPELAQPHRTRRGSWVARAIIAVAVIGGVVWFLRSRSQDRPVGDARTAGASSAEGGPRGGRGGGAGPGGRDGRVVPVQVATVERKDLPIWLEGLGTVAAVQQVTVRPQVDGRIDKVLFTEGQTVRKGDVLVQIDPRPFQVALHQAQGALARDRAQLETLRTNLKRYEGLKAQNLVAGQQVEEIAGQVGQLEGTIRIDMAQIESAQLQLDYAKVKAPIDGITGIRQVDAGNLVRQSDANGIVVITAVDPAAVFFTIPQDRLSSVASALARGDVTVDVYSRDGSTKLARGKVAVLDNQINQATATLRLKALVDNPQRLLWPNAFVKAQMLVETRKDAVVVPTVAIQHGPQGTYVYAVSPEKTAEMKPVTIALTTGEITVIEKGLEGGEQVIVEGQNQVRPGGRVSPGRPQGPGGAGGGQADGAGGGGPGAAKGEGRKGRDRQGAAEAPSGATQGSAEAPGAPAAPAPAAPAPADGSADPSRGGRRRGPSASVVPGDEAARPASGQSREPVPGATAATTPTGAP